MNIYLVISSFQYLFLFYYAFNNNVISLACINMSIFVSSFLYHSFETWIFHLLDLCVSRCSAIIYLYISFSLFNIHIIFPITQSIILSYLLSCTFYKLDPYHKLWIIFHINFHLNTCNAIFYTINQLSTI